MRQDRAYGNYSDYLIGPETDIYGEGPGSSERRTADLRLKKTAALFFPLNSNSRIPTSDALDPQPTGLPCTR